MLDHWIPLPGRIIIRITLPEKSGNLYLAQKNKTPDCGTVLSVGGAYTLGARTWAPPCTAGDTVYFRAWKDSSAGRENRPGQTIAVWFEDVLAVVRAEL